MDIPTYDMMNYLCNIENIANTKIMDRWWLIYLMCKPSRHNQESNVKFNVTNDEQYKDMGIVRAERNLTAAISAELENYALSKCILTDEYAPTEIYVIKLKNGTIIDNKSFLEGDNEIKIDDRFYIYYKPDYVVFIVDQRTNTKYYLHDIYNLTIAYARILVNYLPDVFTVKPYERYEYMSIYNNVHKIVDIIKKRKYVNLVADVLLPTVLDRVDDIINYCAEVDNQISSRIEEDSRSAVNVGVVPYDNLEEECPICRELLRVMPVIRFKCNHYMHYECFTRGILSRCPCCNCNIWK